MEDVRFTVNNLGDGCWLFEGPSRSGKNDLAEFIEIPNLRVIDIYRVDDFVMALNNRTKAIKLSNNTIKHNFIFMVKDPDVAKYIRNWFYDGDFSHRMANTRVAFKKVDDDTNAKILPPDTEISKYFEYRGKIFEKLKLPDGRLLVQVVHTWGDGEIMSFGFEYSDGIPRTGINPLHVVWIYGPQELDVDHRLIEDGIDIFLARNSKKVGVIKGE